METSRICSANQLAGFYMMGTFVVKGLSISNTNMNFGDMFCRRASVLSLCRTEMLNLNSSHQVEEIWVFTLLLNQFHASIPFLYPQKTQLL